MMFFKVLLMIKHKVGKRYPTATEKTKKRFSEKPIVVFTNTRVFLLDIAKPLWSHVLALSA